MVYDIVFVDPVDISPCEVTLSYEEGVAAIQDWAAGMGLRLVQVTKFEWWMEDGDKVILHPYANQAL
jgi:hypothetical protein